MYTLQFHKNLTLQKWSAYRPNQQICMIGNELNRLANGLSVGQSFYELQACIERAFELIDLTINTQQKNLRRELLYFRDLLAELYLLDEIQLKNCLERIKKLYRALLLLNAESAAII